MWILLAFISAALLGVYDIFKKLSLVKNAVVPVLFLSSLFNAIIFIPIIFIGHSQNYSYDSLFNFTSLTFHDHCLFLLKSFIVGTSWTLAYYAIKYLPITIISPIRSSGPLWTLLGALIIFGEKLTYWQWIGIIITLIFYYIFSHSSEKEGFSFKKNRWILFMILSTIVGSISSLYDKYLVLQYNRLAMQAYYHLYMVPLMFILLMVIWYPFRYRYERFQWRWSIILISICLTVADFIYFWSLSYPDALISIVSTVRRGSVIFSFAIGAILFKEKNIFQKALILLGILIGITIIIFTSS